MTVSTLIVEEVSSVSIYQSGLLRPRPGPKSLIHTPGFDYTNKSDVSLAHSGHNPLTERKSQWTLRRYGSDHRTTFDPIRKTGKLTGGRADYI